MKTLKKQFTKILPLLLAILFFTACNRDDAPINQLKGIWKASDTEYFSFQDKKIIFYLISNYEMHKSVKITTGNYVYDVGSQNIYISTSGESATLYIEKLDKNSLVLKNNKENEVVVLNRHIPTLSELPQDLTGYTLHYESLTVYFDSNGRFRIINPEGAFISLEFANYYEVKELGYSYKKTTADKATLTLSYSVYEDYYLFKSKNITTDVLEITHHEDLFINTKGTRTDKHTFNDDPETTQNIEFDYYGVLEH